MPAGALWTLRYNPTVDGRILARSDAARLRADEFVQNVAVTSTRDSCTVVIQFHDDRDGPNDPRIRGEIESWLVPESPQEIGITARTRDELISLAIGTPIRQRAVPQYSNPIRRNRDYTAVARRTFLVDQLPDPDTLLVTDPPDRGMGGAEFGSDIHNSIGEMSRLIYQGLGVPSELLGVPLEAPTWLTVGAWVQHKQGDFAEVSKLEIAPPHIITRVYLKLWRTQAPVQSLSLGDFLRNWVSCERPPEPTTRYERIRKSFR